MATKDASHATLYRQYRPKDFSEVRGQEHIVKSLEGAIKNKRIAHAYLFAGSRGTGKTSIARILARMLGVTDRDLYEIDAASNTGVDNIRDLREGVIVRPFESPYKLYIIDEAHMLSKAAWNALLKTLEEPPSHAIFVLATTEKEKVPDTIQSRCEIYAFKQPTREVLTQIVTDVAKAEGYSLEKSAAELVALLAEGSFRDALSILQKVLAVSTGKKIAAADVEQVTGAPTGEIVRNLVTGIAKKDASMALKAIRQTVADNMDSRVLAKLLLLRMRAILLLRYAPDLADSMLEEMTEADVELAKSLVKDPGITSDTLRKFLEAYGTMAYAAVPHLPLELAVVDATAKAA
jgi:DNA polymerase-3 subunit gamma/tau